MLNVNLFKPDGSIELLGDSGGYLELNLYQQTWTSGSDGVDLKKQKFGLHYCNDDDRSIFYDQSD